MYLNDLLNTIAVEKARLKALEEVLSKLQEAALRLKREKCFLYSKEVGYLGHHIEAEGIHPLAEKVKADH